MRTTSRSATFRLNHLLRLAAAVALLMICVVLPTTAQVPTDVSPSAQAASKDRMDRPLKQVYEAIAANEPTTAQTLITEAIGDQPPNPEARALRARIGFLQARDALRDGGGAAKGEAWNAYLERFGGLESDLDQAVKQGDHDAQTQYLVGAVLTDHADLLQERLNALSNTRNEAAKTFARNEIEKYIPLGYGALSKCLELDEEHLDALCHFGGQLARFGEAVGAGMLMQALEIDPQRAGPLRDLLENLPELGLLRRNESRAWLEGIVRGQGEAASEILREAAAKHSARHRRISYTMERIAALGTFPPPALQAERYSLAEAKAFCERMLAEIEKQ